jgi:hypothetical protein
MAPGFGVGRATRVRYGGFVSPVRILIDGYSLLHQWPELAPGSPRHSARARDALI